MEKFYLDNKFTFYIYEIFLEELNSIINEFENIDSLIESKKNDLGFLHTTIVEKDKVRIEKFKKDFYAIEG